MTSEIFVPPPGHPLRAFIMAIFHAKRRVDFECEWILPKGNIDILVNLGSPIAASGPNFNLTLGTHDVLVAGLHTRAFQTRPGRDFNLIGLSLHAHTASAVLPLPPGKLRDRYVHAHLVSADLALLGQRVGEAPDFDARVRLFVEWIGSRLNPTRRFDVVRQCAAVLRQRPSDALATRLARAHDISSRQLHRVFTEYVGVGPAQYAKMARFTQALALMQRMPSLTDVAYAAHYTDQAHFCRDFKALASMTPTEYLQGAERQLPGHVYVR